MPKFGTRSLMNISGVHKELKRLFEEVVKTYDCSVLCGHRSKADQDQAYADGKSKVQYPNSKHNSKPSRAVDVAPYPIDWNDMKRWYHFGGYVKAVAESMGIDIIWGGDWDGDFDLKDQNFNDLPHFELAPTVPDEAGVEYLPDGPSDDNINITLDEIEKSIFDD